MKFIIKAADLKQGFKDLAMAMQNSSRSVGSILNTVEFSYVRLTAYPAGNKIMLENAREGIYARSILDAQVQEGGTIIFPCSYLYGLAFPEEDAFIEINGNNMQVTCGKMTVNLDGIINNEALTINPIEEIPFICEIPFSKFQQSRVGVGFPQMHTGSGQRPLIRHKCENGVFAAHANDKYSLAIHEIGVENSTPAFDLVLPVAFEDGLLAILAKQPSFWLGYNDRAIRMANAVFDITFPRIQEPTPYSLVKDVKGMVDRVMKKEQTAVFMFNAQEALSTVSSVASLQVSSKSKQFRIYLEVKEDHVLVSSTTSFGKSRNKFPAIVQKGAGTQISCHSTVLTTFLNLLAKSNVQYSQWNYEAEKGINTLKNEIMTLMFTSVS